MPPIFAVEASGREHWAVVRYFDGEKFTCHMTGSQLEALRMRDELERADKRAFYEGLLTGRAEGEALARQVAM